MILQNKRARGFSFFWGAPLHIPRGTVTRVLTSVNRVEACAYASRIGDGNQDVFFFFLVFGRWEVQSRKVHKLNKRSAILL